MSNEFFEHTTPFIPNSKVKSDEANGKFDAIQRAFDKLPTEQQLKSGNLNYAVDTGTANNYVVALPYAPASYFEGLSLSFKAKVTNTGSSVINVNGLGNKSILLPDGTPLGAGDIPANGVVSLVYGAGSFQFQGTSISKTNLAAQKASEASASAAAAAASQAAAASSQTAAANSATAAANSASNAAGSASAAASSASSASTSAATSTTNKDLALDWAIKTSAPVSGSEWSAKKHAQDAAGFSSNASTKAAEAASSASNAASSASAASTSATSANSSKNAAATSATNAANSATAAASSATSASNSATSASSSATNAGNSASAAATSEANAAYWADQAQQVAGGQILDDSQVLTTKGWSSSKISSELGSKAATGHTHGAATTSVAGFMAAADKSKLDGIAAQATRTVISDGATGTGTVWSSQKVSDELATKLGSTANAVSATKLATARTIALSGGVTGSGSFDGTGNLTISATVTNNGHSHTIANVTGLQAELDAKLASAGGVVTGNLSVHTGVDGGYGTTNSSGTTWGACIWGMGPSYDGVGANTTYEVTNHYGVSWLRASHSSADAQIGEGAYIFQGGVFKGGVGSAGIKTAGVFYGNGSGLTSLNANNLSVGTIPDARLSGTYTGVSITGNAATATKLATARTIGGVSFDGTANINLPGVNAAGNQNTTGSAATLTTARTLTIGSAGKTFNGSANVTWTLAEIGAASSGVTIDAGNGLTGGGALTGNRTLTLGTPSTLTMSSTNAVTATSHTHAIDVPAATAWVNFNGAGTLAIRDSYNVSSITDNGTGQYTVNFASAMANTNYATQVSASNSDGNYNPFIQSGSVGGAPTSKTVSGIRVMFKAGSTFQDVVDYNVTINGGM